MIADSLYHPPALTINVDDDNTLILNHVFEGKPLYRDYIEGTLLGLEFLWGAKVSLYTHEAERLKEAPEQVRARQAEGTDRKIVWKRFRYTMKERKLTRVLIN